jgi:alkylhydroperoxidase family enzyme
MRMLSHSSGVLEGIAVMGNALLTNGTLDPVLREIAIIRTGVLHRSAYEVHQHERIGRLLGMSDELLAAIHAGPDSSAFNELQRQVMCLTDDIVANSRASDSTFAPLASQLSHVEMIELVICIGFYTMVSNFLNTLDIEIEATDRQPDLSVAAR